MVRIGILSAASIVARFVEASRTCDHAEVVGYQHDRGIELVFEGFVADKMLTGRPESHWTTTCGGGQNVVVNFHNGQ